MFCHASINSAQAPATETQRGIENVIPEIPPFRSDHTTAKQYRGSQYVEIPDIEQLDRIRDINHEGHEEREEKGLVLLFS